MIVLTNFLTDEVQVSNVNERSRQTGYRRSLMYHEGRNSVAYYLIAVFIFTALAILDWKLDPWWSAFDVVVVVFCGWRIYEIGKGRQWRKR